MNEVVIDDSQREMCAVLVMRTMLTDYCNDTGVSFNDVFFRFVTSPAYKMLFDYEHEGFLLRNPKRLPQQKLGFCLVSPVLVWYDVLGVFHPFAPDAQQAARCQVLDNFFHK